jgi:hypothetical protein
VRYRHDVSFGNQAAFVALTVLCWYELEPVDCLALVRGRMAHLLALVRGRTAPAERPLRRTAPACSMPPNPGDFALFIQALGRKACVGLGWGSKIRNEVRDEEC